jgi:hypothetical protein
MLTGAEMEEYSKENLITPYLAISILRGEMIPKSKEDTKLHHSYETILRLLPYEEVMIDNKEEVDREQYISLFSTISPITISKVFDGYRTLLQELETCGIFSKDHTTKAQQYNEDEFTRRRAIIIDAAFPKTFRRSSLGMSLTEQQLQMRVVMLNNWFGALLKMFVTMPNDAQVR